ncbi:MAG: hypothetical protein H8D63_02785 [Parcubacteria group bacterium]|nr:hypothetical protein [Parcubacteria group bacterium]
MNNIKNYFSFKLITSFVGAMMFLSPFAVSANTITPREGKESIPIHANSIEKELSRAVNAKDFGYGKDATEKVCPRSVTPVAILKVFADSSGGSSGYVSGHAFITVKNVSGGSITIGRLSGIANKKLYQLGHGETNLSMLDFGTILNPIRCTTIMSGQTVNRHRIS